MKAKPGQLKMGWSKREGDVMYAWGGDGADKTDASLLHAVLTVPLKYFDKTFQEELIERGYDITTMKFSIQKTRLTKRAPDLGQAGDSESQNTVAPSG